MMRVTARALAALLLACAAPAFARGPEQIDQIEPGRGRWQAEYFGTFGPGGEREHAIEAMLGLTDRLAIGVEIEAEYSAGNLTFDAVGLKALYRLTGDDAPVALGLQVQLAIDDRAVLVDAETRLIAEVESGGWWGQGNVMLRRSKQDGEAVAGLAYALSLQHSLGEHVWLGVEGSGQSTPLWGADPGAESGHFAGPSLTFEWEPHAGREIELGIAYFRRLGGEGPRGSGRLFLQATF